MSKQGIIPKRLSKCKPPACSACIAGQTAKRKWRDKPRKDEEEKVKRKPGEVTSIDMLVSPTPGFIAQMASFLTKERCCYATVFVDQASRLGYVYFQKKATVEETLLAKKAWEKYAESHGIHIRGYHDDNGIFKAKWFVNNCNEQNQTLTFAGVNAHHQNGIAERRIKQLQDQTRSIIIYSNARWPKCISTELWPYAIRMANESINIVPSMQDKERRSPLQIFSKTKVNVECKHYAPFGCPTFVLNNELQQNKPFHKWNSREQAGICLGPSPLHNRNVALVLNRFTGLVSPQFHIRFDKNFRMVTQGNYESLWQQKTGFQDDPQQRTERSKPATKIK